MSIRHECSYWLKAEPNPALPVAVGIPEVMNALNASSLAGDAEWTCMVFSEDGYVITGEIDPNKGTIEQDDGLQEAAGKIAAMFPSWIFSLEERDEEDRSAMSVTEWKDGKCLGVRYARTLEPGELDLVTIDNVIAYLRENRQDMVAGFLEKHYKNIQ